MLTTTVGFVQRQSSATGSGGSNVEPDDSSWRAAGLLQRLVRAGPGGQAVSPDVMAARGVATTVEIGFYGSVALD